MLTIDHILYIVASAFGILSYITTIMALPYHVPMLLWITSIICAITPLGYEGYLRLQKSKFRLRVSVYAVLGILIILIAFSFRMYHLSDIPRNLDGDYASVGLQAREFLRTNHPGIHEFGWANIPMVGYMPVVLSMFVFGDSLRGLNMGSVIESMLSLVIIYHLGKHIHSSKVGLYAMMFAAFSYVHIHFGRTAMYFDPVLFISLSVLLFLKGMERNSRVYMITSGIAAGFCIFLYFSGRAIFFIVPLCFVYVTFMRKSRTFIDICKHALWWIWGATLVIGPFLFMFFTQYDAFMARTKEVFLFSPDVIQHLKGVYQTQDLKVIVWEQVRRSLLMFHSTFDTGTQFGMKRPFLDPLTGGYFIVGLMYVLRNISKVKYASILVWIVVVMITGAILTNNPPFWPRLVSLIMPACLLAAIGCNLVIEIISHVPVYRWIRSICAVLLIVGVFGYVLIFNWTAYLESQSSFAFPRTLIGRYLADNQLSAFMVENGEFSCQDREIQFLAERYCMGNVNLTENMSLDAGRAYIVPLRTGRLSEAFIKQIVTSTHQIAEVKNTTGDSIFTIVQKQ